jgi:hypothetical protein
MPQRPTDYLVLSEELIRLRELRRSAFFDEILRPGGLGHPRTASVCDLRSGQRDCRIYIGGRSIRP